MNKTKQILSELKEICKKYNVMHDTVQNNDGTVLVISYKIDSKEYLEIEIYDTIFVTKWFKTKDEWDLVEEEVDQAKLKEIVLSYINKYRSK